MKKIILGSASPRRKELLASLGFTFEVRVKDTDESCPDTIPAIDRAVFIANKKAKALKDDLNENEILLCADTIVVLGEKIMNKPRSKDEAFQMLSEISGKTHQVVTGFVIVAKDIVLQESVITFVEFNKIPKEDILRYIEECHPLDKAGAYGIQEWIGAAFVKQISGSYNNVVGLPTAEVFMCLRSLI